jgi:hypothetical protein
VCVPCPAGSSTGGDRAQAACFPCELGSFAGPGAGVALCELAPLVRSCSQVRSTEHSTQQK